MESQGWIPGSGLGARKASFLKQNPGSIESSVGITLKDDKHGLGVVSNRGDGQPTGLSVFNQILGRLNGNTNVDLDHGKNQYENFPKSNSLEERLHSPRFISGGFLTHDKDDHRAHRPLSNHSPCTTISLAGSPPDMDLQIQSNVDIDCKVSIDAICQGTTEHLHSHKSATKSKKYRKNKRDCNRLLDSKELSRTAPTENESALHKDLAIEKRAYKSSANKAQLQQEPWHSDPEIAETPSSKSAGNELGASEHMSPRHGVRKRYIRHKQMALTNVKALNEVRSLS